jgi:threonine dehydrogenase-like Zn-dependent dehydrogenase
MKAAVFTGNRHVSLEEFPDPTPGDGEVILEIKASGMCGSDLHAYRAKSGAEYQRPRVIAGHEPAGIVAAVGAAVPAHVAKVGDRMMVHHYYGCTICPHCRSGWSQLCKAGAMQLYGSNAHGSHARYMKVPASILLRLREELSFAAGAAISCGTGTAWGALERLNATGADTIAIFGQGPVGISATMLAASRGCEVIAIDIVDSRLALAKQFGATHTINSAKMSVPEAIGELTNGRGVALVLESSGNSKAAQDAIASLGVWGKACFAGIGAQVSFDLLAQLGKQITLMTTWSMSSIGQQECADFIVRRRLPVDKLFSDTWSLDRVAEAYESFDKQTSGKGLIVP